MSSIFDRSWNTINYCIPWIDQIKTNKKAIQNELLKRFKIKNIKILILSLTMKWILWIDLIQQQISKRIFPIIFFPTNNSLTLTSRRHLANELICNSIRGLLSNIFTLKNVCMFVHIQFQKVQQIFLHKLFIDLN